MSHEEWNCWFGVHGNTVIVFIPPACCTHQGQWEAHWNSDKSKTDALFSVFTSEYEEKQQQERQSVLSEVGLFGLS